MSGVLDWLHRAGAIVAGVLLVAVAALTLVPIGARLLGLPAHSWDEVATFVWRRLPSWDWHVHGARVFTCGWNSWWSSSKVWRDGSSKWLPS